MSADPNNLEEFLRRAESRRASPRAKKGPGCLTGCLGTVGGLIVAALVISLFFNPWALHMGGRWTPTLTWHGVGRLHSSTGATYGLFLEVSLYADTSEGESNQNLQGTAKLCTPQGESYRFEVAGYVKRVWLDAEGKQVTFYVSTPRGWKPPLRMDLVGSWQGQELILEDKGSLAESFAADGTARGYLQGKNAPKENATLRLRYAPASEFPTVCGGKGASSF